MMTNQARYLLEISRLKNDLGNAEETKINWLTKRSLIDEKVQEAHAQMDESLVDNNVDTQPCGSSKCVPSESVTSIKKELFDFIEENQ